MGYKRVCSCRSRGQVWSGSKKRSPPLRQFCPRRPSAQPCAKTCTNLTTSIWRRWKVPARAPASQTWQHHPSKTAKSNKSLKLPSPPRRPRCARLPGETVKAATRLFHGSVCSSRMWSWRTWAPGPAWLRGPSPHRPPQCAPPATASNSSDVPPERKRRERDSWKPRTSWLGRSRKSCGRSGENKDEDSQVLVLLNRSVLHFPAVTTRTQWSRRVALKKMLAVARNSSRRLLPHPQLLPRPLTPHRPHPRINRPHPLPPLLHRVLQTSRGRWRAAVSRRGAGGRRWARTLKEKQDDKVRSVSVF